MPAKRKTTVSLVLGSGALEAWHTDIIHELQDRGYELFEWLD